ncbi:unnamed protein product [Lampetra planeri]
MSKYQKKRNPLVASSEDDENETQDLLTALGTAVPIIEATVGELGAPETVGPGAASLQQQPPEEGWRMVSAQLELLRATVSQLVVLKTATAMERRTTQTSPEKSNQAPGFDILAGTSTSVTAAITRGAESTAIPTAKKTALQGAYAEMAEVYEPPSDTRKKFLQRSTVVSVTVQALSRDTLEIPPGSQMLVPLHYRKRLHDVDPEAGVLLTPSNTATLGFPPVGALTVLRLNQEPFLQVLNVRPGTAVVQAASTGVMSALEEVELAEVVAPCDSVLHLTHAEWGRLEMEDVSLMALRRQAELSHKVSALTDEP